VITRTANQRHTKPKQTQGRECLRTELPRWVWALDSNVVINRSNALEQAVRRAEEASAAIVGESWRDDEHDMDRFLAYSLLIDPVRVWRDRLSPSLTAGIPRSACSSPRKRKARRCPSSPSRETAT
jgi:hypothetical protein